MAGFNFKRTCGCAIDPALFFGSGGGGGGGC